jgi:hypothetical protein
MRVSLRLVLFTLLAYGLFLVAQLPARLLLESGSPPAGWQLSEPQGTVWRGTIAEIHHQGRPLGRVQWRLRPWRLLLGDLAVAWNLDGPHGTAQGEFRRGIQGEQLAVHDVTLDLAPAMAAALGWTPVTPGGRVTGRLEQLVWRRGEGLQVTGQLQWRNATLQFGETLSLGNVLVRAGGQGQQDIVIEGDAAGDVRLDGRLEWLSANRFDLFLTLDPLNEGGRQLLEHLGAVGTVTRQGAVQFRHRGELPLN